MLFFWRVFVAALDKVARPVDNWKRQLTLAAKATLNRRINSSRFILVTPTC